jgi:hypothetical protein
VEKILSSETLVLPSSLYSVMSVVQVYLTEMSVAQNALCRKVGRSVNGLETI